MEENKINKTYKDLTNKFKCVAKIRINVNQFYNYMAFYSLNRFEEVKIGNYLCDLISKDLATTVHENELIVFCRKVK